MTTTVCNHILLVSLVLAVITAVHGLQYKAIAVLSPTNPSEPISGTIKLTLDDTTNMTTVEAYITGIKTNPNVPHGIHLHQFGDLRGLFPSAASSSLAGGNSVGGHFNPLNAPHGCPDSPGTWHSGDLGNFNAVNGVISQTVTIPSGYITQYPGDILSIIGRGATLHETTDNCVNLTSAGKRLAIGVIGLMNPSSTTVGKGGPGGAPTKAVCVLQGSSTCKTNCGLAGILTFENSGSSFSVTAEIYGLTSQRGLHIHEFGDLSVADGTSAGVHYNPEGNQHGLPPATVRHAGDLGGISTFVGSNGYYSYTPTFSRAYSVQDIIGRAVILHQDVDHGLDPSCSNVSGYIYGAAGNREYICVIGIPNSAADSTVGSTNFLPSPQIPSGTTFSNSWTMTPCSSSIVKPPPTGVTSPSAGGNNNLFIGIVIGIAVVGIIVIVVIVIIGRRRRALTPMDIEQRTTML